jgi:hypothetical protein
MKQEKGGEREEGGFSIRRYNTPLLRRVGAEKVTKVGENNIAGRKKFCFGGLGCEVRP